jgi:hypothetical protein
MGALRTLFGPSWKEIRRQRCTETGAEHVAGGFGNGDEIGIAIGVAGGDYPRPAR